MLGRGARIVHSGHSSPRLLHLVCGANRDFGLGGSMISKIDFVAIPSQDGERSRAFYGETLGLRPDEHGQYEFWAGDTCLGIYEPTRFGMEFAPQKNAHLALHVDDVAMAREELESRGVSFTGDILDTGVCHMAFFTDPDGNDLMLHHRYAPFD